MSINQVPRIDNSHANALVNLGSTIQTKSGVTVPVIYIQWPAVWKPQEVKDVSENISWMTPISQYLANGKLPQDRSQSRKITAKAVRFTLYGSNLYKWSYSGPLLRCLNPTEAHYVLTELHEGECGNHLGSRSLGNRALTTSYYWPTMRADSLSFALKCDKCQLFAQVSHMAPEKLHSILAP
uniref:Integrase zinc-binding domain-containing protein n=1 Tax=Cannabis sativa TaxID=3483 RepID=A0A803P9J6_CANSA